MTLETLEYVDYVYGGVVVMGAVAEAWISSSRQWAWLVIGAVAGFFMYVAGQLLHYIHSGALFGMILGLLTSESVFIVGLIPGISYERTVAVRRIMSLASLLVIIVTCITLFR